MLDYKILNRVPSVGDFARAEEEFQLKKRKLLEEATGQDPATVKIANEIESALKSGNVERANLLHQIHKTMDKGILPYGMAQENTPTFQYPDVMGGAAKNPPPLPIETGDPLQDSINAIQKQQETTGVNPYQRMDLVPQSNRGVGVMPGYADAVGSIAGTKKRIETQNQKNVELNMDPMIAAEKERQTLSARYLEEGRQSLPKAQRALAMAGRSSQNIMRVVGQVEKNAQKAFTTGFTGSIVGAVPGTEAFNLNQNLKTLRANAAFDTLQNMRNNSPTGGALGAISEKELALLESAYTNLENSQTYDQFVQNLEAFKAQNAASLQAMTDAYAEDYQRFGGQNDAILPAPNARQVATPTERPQATPNTSTRDALIKRLRAEGVPEARIQGFLKSKGY
jgi:hypothetical protein